ncbi:MULTISPECIES: low molecular weight protein-tyrosine-phosphatase [Vibrio]|uniref:protein-tyrosine-phosphatase n=2 Tax=Vibrio TaxID=662 RepID=A0A7X4LPY0_9VIBR|nr:MULTISPECIES: low molecular weight protein-tyrosine-phosphatase [Vibrio]MBF9002166.1 low molecular weight phosphotyrosine protein phosphatase [Vibrio nitrifigilis]MZI96003.1 low molecular weight phosphotyrosine protein phosphatase [Vibrio eleionomae]
MNKSVLVVCTGNLCRSPYAEYRLRELCPDLAITSAGLQVTEHHLEGKKADKVAIQVAKEMGIDLSQHKAMQLNEALVDAYDVILVMEREQQELFCELFPYANYKVYLFGLWNGGVNIDDPFNKGQLAFRLAFNMIDNAVKSWSNKLMQ